MARPAPLWLLLLLQIVVSAASLVVEIVAGRMLAPHVGMSLYTWTSVIAVVLAGFSAGHWWGGILADRPDERALRATGLALMGGAASTAVAAGLLAWLAGPVLAGVGHPVWGIAVLATLVFFAPSLFAGVPAPVLAKLAARDPARAGRALGAMFAAGALGAIAGTLLAGFLFISWLGTTVTLASVVAIYGLAALACFWLARGRLTPGALAAAALAALALAAPSPCTRESRYFCIRTMDLSADPNSPVRLMVIDHLGHGVSARDEPTVMFTEHAAMLDALARVRAPERFSSFFIGGGSFSVPRAFAARATGPVTVAEIDPEVTEIAARDFWFDPASAAVLHEDARRALLTRPEARYDIVIGDAFTDVAVPAHLVTREFFELVRARTNPGGSFLMNVIDYQDRLHALGALVTTLQQVFPVVEVWTRAVRPEPGARLVFVLVAGDTPTPQATITVPAPDLETFGAMSDRWVQAVAATSGLVLTDDFAPIDRLMGRPD
ncbi:MAG: fused MFS/spermidine synthase [Pseudooceanicola sp.]|nr:fused MFS/spermidine synthase [Pseudooceanicola sp.]